MQPAQSFTLFPLLFLVLATLTSAWPRFLPERDSLFVRADKTTSPPESTTAGTSSTDSAKSHSSTTANSGETSVTSLTTPTASHTTYDAVLPAGGISMITPAILSGSQYYKIGDYVTFVWNYTSLSATPTALNILASCSLNNEIYTIGLNQSVGTTGAVTWDTGATPTPNIAYPNSPYNLIIYDAAEATTAVPEAGYLAVYNQYSFGMYNKAAYTDVGAFMCATCSGALSGNERQALGFMALMGTITVLSFTWFVGGMNIIW